VSSGGVRAERTRGLTYRLNLKTGRGPKHAAGSFDMSQARLGMKARAELPRMTAMRPIDLSTHICAAGYFLILLRRYVSGPAHSPHATESTHFTARRRIGVRTEERDGRIVHKREWSARGDGANIV